MGSFCAASDSQPLFFFSHLLSPFAERAPPPAEPEPVTVVFKPKIEKGELHVQERVRPRFGLPRLEHDGSLLILHDPVSMRICRAKYDYKPTQQDDIAMAKKELLYLLAERSDGWTQALNLHGQVGFVPTSYIEEVQPTEGITFAPASKLRINRKQPGEALGMSLAGGSPVYVDDVSTRCWRCWLQQLFGAQTCFSFPLASARSRRTA